MIKKLQKRFILTVMISLAAVFAVLICAIFGVTRYRTIEQEQEMLRMLSENEGAFPKFDFPFEPDGERRDEFGPRDREEQQFGKLRVNAETRYTTRYFTVSLNESGEVVNTRMDNIAAIGEEDARLYAQEAAETGKQSGTIGNYRYLCVEKNYGKFFVFMDISENRSGDFRFFATSIVIAAISWGLLFVLIALISKKVARPFAESYEKQRQFITDASHELKTPIAIISANADILSLTDGENDWVDGIKKQTQKMTHLVKNLTSLAKMDEMQKTSEWVDFNLSEAAEDTASAFAALSESQGKTFRMEIEENLRFYGDEGLMRQLVSILCDNAVKYALDESEIVFSLYRKGKKTVITTENACAIENPSEISRYFERFYRSAISRSEKAEGSGIGLSIAQSITELHKGKISAQLSDHNRIVFTAVF